MPWERPDLQVGSTCPACAINILGIGRHARCDEAPNTAVCRCVGSPDPGPLSPEHAKLMTNFAKAVVRRLQALHFVQLDDVSPCCQVSWSICLNMRFVLLSVCVCSLDCTASAMTCCFHCSAANASMPDTIDRLWHCPFPCLDGLATMSD